MAGEKMTYLFSVLNDKQLLFNWMNVVIITLMACRLFFCKYKLNRDSFIGTAMIILCVWKVYELLSNQSTAGLSSIASNLFLCVLIFAAKGNVMQVFKKVKDERSKMVN
jgi:hypothetical protein